MKTSKLDLDIQNFVQSLQSQPNGNEKIKICVAMRLGLEKSHTPSSIRKYLTAYRKELKNEFGANSTLLKFLKLRKEVGAKIEKDYKRKVQIRTEKNDLIKIEQPSELIEFAKSLLISESYLKVSLGLMLLTGRRSVEILKTAIFHKIPNKAFKVIFEGQAKLKERKANPYEIPLLCTANEAIKALNFIREKRSEFAQLTSEELNKKCAKSLNDTAKIFKDFLGLGVVCHDLRKAYAAIIYNQSKTVDSFRVFAAKFLGHSENSELTTETYLKYTI